MGCKQIGVSLSPYSCLTNHDGLVFNKLGKEVLASTRSYRKVLNDYMCIFMIWRMLKGKMVFVLGKKTYEGEKIKL